MAGYEQQRNALGHDDYWQNLSAARFERPPDALLKMRTAIRDDHEATRRFYLAREGLIATGG